MAGASMAYREPIMPQRQCLAIATACSDACVEYITASKKKN